MEIIIPISESLLGMDESDEGANSEAFPLNSLPILSAWERSALHWVCRRAAWFFSARL